jgi:hypothetical protein
MRRRAIAILLVPLAVAVVLTLFAWPAARLEPRDLPVGVAGPPAAVEGIERQLARADGSYDVHRYPGERDARAAIEERDVYGAFVATSGGMAVLTASAARPSVAALLEQVGAGARPAAAGPAAVDDVVSAPDEDPRGAALPASVLPLVLAGLLTGVAATLLAPDKRRRPVLMLAGAALAGLAATGIVEGWLGVVEGGWVANWGALSLTVLAIASLVAGLAALLGRIGIALGSLTLVVIGNAFSAASSAPEMLPEPAGAIGQLLPPGAGASLLRSTAFFDGAGAGGHVVVLAAWVVAGLALLVAAAIRDRRAPRPPERPPHAPQADRRARRGVRRKPVHGLATGQARFTR